MDLNRATATLSRTPGVLRALVAGLPTEWVHRDDGPGTWSAYDIVGHLLLADGSNWLPRIRTILAHGGERPFQPFDREAMRGWDREPVGALIARFGQARAASVATVEGLGLTGADLDRRGRHPEMGEVTLGQVLAAWVAHDLTHIGQVAEVLARDYREAVGPFRAFMPALDRTAAAE